MGDPSFYNLEFLKLENCQKSTSLPSLQRLPRLKELIITGIHAVQTMMLDEDNSSSTFAFPSLESLKLQDCPILKGKFPKCISTLKKLEIACPELIYSPISLPSLEELCVEGCSEAVLRSMVDLNSLKTLKISRISKLIWLPKSFVESLIALEVMDIRICDELTCLWEEGANMLNLPCLKRMQIGYCSQLASLTGKEQGFLPNSVQTLDIRGCGALESLPSEMMMERLEKLYIYGCPALRMFPRGKLPTTLKILEIGECEKLESLPEGMLMKNGDACQVSHLEELTIYKCPYLKSFPTGHLPNSFKRLYVNGCKQLEFIPQRMLQNYRELEEIHIYGNDPRSYSSKYERCYIHCDLGIENLDGLDGLDSLCPFIPNLKSLTISDFKNLKSLSDRLQDLNSLSELYISNCPGIESIPDGGLPPNLTSLEIYSCPGIEFILDGGLPPNLTSLEIHSCPGIEFIPDGGLPPNLTSLEIYSCPRIEFISDGGFPLNLRRLHICYCRNLKSLLDKLQDLNSLDELCISDCPGIESIPDSGFSPNLRSLTIDCKNLKKPMQEWGLSSLTSLQTFKIDWICPPDNVLPASLTSLAVGRVENMKSIPRGLLQNLNSLQHLEIYKWSKLQTLPKEPLPASLQRLHIWECNNFQSLPNKVLPPLLQSLQIGSCDKFQSLPNKGPLSSLELLYIARCPLLERRSIEEKGEYWPFVAHIPYFRLADW